MFINPSVRTIVAARTGSAGVPAHDVSNEDVDTDGKSVSADCVRISYAARPIVWRLRSSDGEGCEPWSLAIAADSGRWVPQLGGTNSISVENSRFIHIWRPF